MENLRKILEAKKRGTEKDIPLEIYLNENGKKQFCECIFGKIDIKDLDHDALKNKIYSLYGEYHKEKGLKRSDEITAGLIESIVLGGEGLNEFREKCEKFKLSDEEKKLYQSLFDDIWNYIKKELELLHGIRMEKVSPLLAKKIASDDKWILIQFSKSLVLMDRNLISMIKAPIKEDDPVYKKDAKQSYM